MPTFSKLAAALILAAAAWVGSNALLDGPDLPVVVYYFAEWNALLGLLIGWRLIGSSAGRGLVPGIAGGFSGGVAFLIVSAFLWSSWGMLRRALRKLYDGPVEALIDVARIMIDLVPFYLVSGMLLPVLGGGLVAGLVSELLADRRPA